MPTDAFTKKYLVEKPPQQKTPEFGDLEGSSIFDDEEATGTKPTRAFTGDQKEKQKPRDLRNMAAALNPNPDARMQWERKMVIRDIRKRGRLTRKQELRRQERELVSKSHNWRTSTKKLMFLARQIQGKPVDEAITQMRFSVKKAAAEVKYHLEHARNEAIVRRGMGLGKIQGTAGSPINIQTKDGKRLKIEDRTRLYIDQAWVGKGDFGTTPDYRARGNMCFMKNPTSHITVVLKEEATRVRLHQDREAKLARQKPWTQLPNRPITAQRQYYSW